MPRFPRELSVQTIYPSDDVAAVFAEAVQADGGDVVPPPDFMPKLRALCDRHGILLVMDEIKIGMGRTGRMFGYEHGGVDGGRRAAREVARRRVAVERDSGAQRDSRRRVRASRFSRRPATRRVARPGWR